MAALKLIVGLGNPGPAYAETRHNVGAVWVRELARRHSISLSLDSKFKGEIGRGLIAGCDVRLLLPGTFMNNSGESVGAVSRFFKFEAAEILVAYDEVAFEPGVVKLKQGGGSNGHNGVKSVIAGLGSRDEFVRLRIGVGHPGSKEQVIPYLTKQTPRQSEREQIAVAGDFADAIIADMMRGEWQLAMTALHAPEKKPDKEPAKVTPNPGET
ncbi:MAG: aminoacyl-tRNA hydrolase [Gammaproteobacteria bacterium]|nr:aminoacyl-tRNA hydrolase [Gammaproteobacteria bacterium]|tara:strand:+ start:1996 stop:2631 length:636 start_codon:yes stop_codon:yes gene_type:complete